MIKTEKVRIKDLGKIITGNTPPTGDETNYGGKYPFIKPTDMNIGERYVYEYEDAYSEQSFKRYKNSYIPKSATGVVTIGTVGEKMFQAHEDCFTNQSVNCVICDEEIYNRDYIFYLLKHNLPKVEAMNPGTASGRHHVSKSNFSSIKVDVIKDLIIQKKIAKKLSNYDDLIENNQKQIELLEKKARLTYEEWFLRFRIDGKKLDIDESTELPCGWGKVTTYKLYNVKYGKTLPQEEILKIGKYKVYGASGQMGYYKKNNVYGNAVLITSRGNGSGEIHRTYSEGFVTNNSFIVLPKKEYQYLGFEFNIYHLRTIGLKNYCSGSAQPQLTNDAMKSIKINLPTKDLILRYLAIASPIIENADNLRLQNQQLKKARDILLPRLMSGMIEV